MKIITAAMKKGGAGKTSTLVPLAWRAHELGHRVALIDTDSTPSAWQWVTAAELEGERFACEKVPAEELGQMLDNIRKAELFDYVFVDTPPGDKHAIVEAMTEADLALMPLHIGSGDVPQLVETWHLMRTPLKANPDLRHLIVLNHAGTMPAVTRETEAAIRGALPEARIAKQRIDYLERYINAKGNMPQFVSRPGHRKDGWWHYENLWIEVEEALK